MNFRNYQLFFISILSLILIISCETDEEPCSPDEGTTQNESGFSLGWEGEDDINTVPSSTNFGFGGGGDLPSSVNLVPKFPPIGNQNPYGTCVSWAVAYNAKTAINGMNLSLSASQLASPSNQFSPRDLFIAIPDGEKGVDCNNTNFSSALNVMQNRGVASMQTVPYTNMGDCRQFNLQSNWNSEASQNKIKYWRKIEGSVLSIRQNLANNIPVILGAKLSDNFMTWTSDDVITSSTSYNTVGQNAYHAMVIAGYDDNRGPNGAFKVINSWGQSWGDGGYIWVGYNYLINEFCVSPNGGKTLFIMADDEGNTSPPNDDPNVTGVDLAPWVFGDFSTYPNTGNPWERVIDFNLYNIGNQAAPSSTDWSFYYIYFNAYNANDYGVVFFDQFNTSVPVGTFNCPSSDNCVFNFPINAGENFSQTVFGTQSVTRTYYMPQITGLYYLVLVADANDGFQEQDELNNLFYTTLDPKYFDNGYSTLQGSSEKGSSQDSFNFENNLELNSKNLKSNRFNTVVTEESPNAYTQEEIISFLNKELQNGNLKRKLDRPAQKSNRASYNH